MIYLINELMHRRLKTEDLFLGVLAMALLVGAFVGAGALVGKLAVLVISFMAIIAFVGLVVFITYRFTPPVQYVERRYIERCYVEQASEPTYIEVHHYHEHIHRVEQPTQRMIEQRPDTVQWRVESPQPQRRMIGKKEPIYAGTSKRPERIGVTYG